MSEDRCTLQSQKKTYFSTNFYFSNSEPSKGAKLNAMIRLRMALHARMDAQSVRANTPFERELKNQVLMEGDALVHSIKNELNVLNQKKKK